MTNEARRVRRVELHPHGLLLGGGADRARRGAGGPGGDGPHVLPLYAGTMHYWRHDPSRWGAGLDAMRAMGLRVLDTYVPWAIHERGPGEFDFGEREPHLDVARFLELADARGLKVVLRPGPHINAELTHFGVPERVVWDRACQARTPRGNPVMLPMVPVAFPVPSYASDEFHREVARWFDAVGARLSRLRHPDGPIVMLQVDNEGALYFRDGAYDQDYHPDAIALFRDLLRAKYAGDEEDLRRAWRDPGVSFATAWPPVRFEAASAEDLPRHMDWIEFHEHLLATGMERIARALEDSGLGELPTMHNLPLGEAATALNAARLHASVDLIALDYYHRATPADHATLLRRTTELAARCEGGAAPAYGAEVGAGFPPFFAPLDEEDSLYTLAAALAYGLRGFNLYMAVERDRWIGAPIDPHGQPRPFADRYHALMGALVRARFHTLRRRAPVRLVVPRSLRRLARVTHAFGPATPALFNVLGAGFEQSCLEDDLASPAIAGEAWLRAFEHALIARGVPFAYAGGETFDAGTAGARWILCATSGGMKADLVALLRDAARRGARVTIGPRPPDRDGSMRALARPYDTGGLELEPLDDAARAASLVARRIDELALPTFPVNPDDVHLAVHEDDEGVARLAFVMNPTPIAQRARVAVAGAASLRDAVQPGAAPVERRGGAFEVLVPARTVRILTIEPRPR